MKKIKYYFNTHTLRFEKLVTPFRVRLLKVFGFFATAIVTAGIIVLIAFQYIDSPKTIMLEQQNADMKEDYALMQQQVNQLQQKMDELLKRDNNVYRSIFESSPIPDSARMKAMEKSQELQKVASLGETAAYGGHVGRANVHQDADQGCFSGDHDG